MIHFAHCCIFKIFPRSWTHARTLVKFCNSFTDLDKIAFGIETEGNADYLKQWIWTKYVSCAVPNKYFKVNYWTRRTRQTQATFPRAQDAAYNIYVYISSIIYMCYILRTREEAVWRFERAAFYYKYYFCSVPFNVNDK